MVSTATILTCVFTLIVCLVLPVVLLILFTLRFKKESILPAWLLGAAGFFVTQMVIRVPILTLLQSQDWFIHFSQKHLFLYAFLLAFTAGLFELAGRFAVAKLMAKNLTFRRSLAAGLGHGGIEAMLLVGMTYINNLIYIFMINTGTFDPMIEEVASMGAAVPQLDATLAQLEMIKTQLINASPALFLLASLERILAMTAHAAMSMIVCYGVAHKKILSCLLLCLGIHTMIDLTAGIQLLGGTVLSQTVLYLIIYLILAIVAAVSLFVIWKLRSRWQTAPQKEVTL